MKKVWVSWGISAIFIYLIGMQFAYLIDGHFGMTFNFKYLFYNIEYFFGLTIFSAIIPNLFLVSFVNTRSRRNPANLSRLATEKEYLTHMTHVKFDGDFNMTFIPNSKDRKFIQKGGMIFKSSAYDAYIDTSELHSLIIGSSGSGKSSSFILPMLCMMAMAGESGVAVDIKGELSEKTANLFIDKGYKVYFIDFIDVHNSNSWNPLYFGAQLYIENMIIQEKELKEFMEKKSAVDRKYITLYGDNLDINYVDQFGKNKNGDTNYDSYMHSFRTTANFSEAEELLRDVANAIAEVGIRTSGDSDFWNGEAARVLEGYIHFLCETGNIDVVSLPAVARLMLEGDEIKTQGMRSSTTYLQYYLNEFKDRTQTSKARLMPYVDSAENTRKSTRNVLTEHLGKMLVSSDVNRMISHNDIDMMQLGREKSIVFLRVHDEKETFYPLLNLFIKQLYQALNRVIREEHKEHLDIPFHIIFDEMGQFKAIPEILGVLTAGRSRWIRLTCAVQGIDQIESKYGKEDMGTILQNCANTVYLMSNNMSTLEMLSKRAGQYEIQTETGKVKEDLITPARLSRFKHGDALILKSGEYPLITKVIPITRYSFYDNLKPYKLKVIPKREPVYFSLIEDIKERERNGKK